MTSANERPKAVLVFERAGVFTMKGRGTMIAGLAPNNVTVDRGDALRILHRAQLVAELRVAEVFKTARFTPATARHSAPRLDG